MTAAAVLLAGCMLLSSCGENEADKTQGFTQSLQEEKKKADEALETFEKASEALDNAIEQQSETGD